MYNNISQSRRLNRDCRALMSFIAESVMFAATGYTLKFSIGTRRGQGRADDFLRIRFTG